MAKKKGPVPGERRTPPGTADDAFTVRVLEFTAWARDRTHVLVIAVAAAVLLVVGAVFWFGQRQQRVEQAAQELDRIQAAVFFEEAPQARAQLRTFLDRFGGTAYEVEARLLLAELLLDDQDPGEAIRVLEAVAPSDRNPLRLQASILLGVAYEQAERWDDAEGLYRWLRRNAEFSFQRRDAGERLAQILVVQGDTAGARTILAEIVNELEEGSPDRSYFEMRLAEISEG
jgi:predicted negative regulator of RcsB-dependent stress response